MFKGTKKTFLERKARRIIKIKDNFFKKQQSKDCITVMQTQYNLTFYLKDLKKGLIG